MTNIHKSLSVYTDDQFLCLAPAVAEDGEDVHEEVDDVQVEVEGGKDVLLGAEGILVAPPHHQLRVVDDVQAASGNE